jgi:hypothetical protein
MPKPVLPYQGELIQAFADIANKLGDSIEEEGPFKTICVDHKSGHYPGVFVDTLLHEIQGDYVPHSDFALTRRNRQESQAHLREAFDQHVAQKRFNPPVLIVSEAVAKGEAVYPLAAYLNDNNIRFRICSISHILGPRHLSFIDRDDYIDSGLAHGIALGVFHGSANKVIETKEGKAYVRTAGAPQKDGKDMYEKMVLLAKEIAKRMLKR